jgi:hypothetical protein
MSEQDLTPDTDDTEGHGMHRDDEDDTTDTDDTEGHGMKH